MHYAVLAIISKEDSQRMTDVRKAVGKLMESGGFDNWVIGGRYAVDSPDAEQMPTPAGLESVRQGLKTPDGRRSLEPETQSFFGDKIIIPVADLTDEQVEKFDSAVMYKTPTERKLAEAWSGPTGEERTRAECCRALFPEDFAVIVDALWITPEERKWPKMKSAFGPKEPESLILWKTRHSWK